MNAIPLWRRFALAGFSLALAAMLFRAPLASALVTRGDDAQRYGDRAAALRYYARALRIDGGSARAADRLAFALSTERDPQRVRTAVAIASAALRLRPLDTDLLADRAFAEERLHRWSAAESDFARAARVGHDPRYDHLAGRVALKLGDRRAARQLFREALAYDARFAPARAALQGDPR